MALALSLIIALALFSLSLTLQSGISLATDEAEKQRLANRLHRVTLAAFVPIGIGMVIAGFLSSVAGDSFVSIGFAIMGTSVVSLTQSELIKRKGEEALTFAGTVRFYGRLFWWVALAAVIALTVRIIVALTCI